MGTIFSLRLATLMHVGQVQHGTTYHILSNLISHFLNETPNCSHCLPSSALLCSSTPPQLCPDRYHLHPLSARGLHHHYQHHHHYNMILASSTTSMTMCLSFALIGITFTLLVLGVFISHHSTPVVRACGRSETCPAGKVTKAKV